MGYSLMFVACVRTVQVWRSHPRVVGLLYLPFAGFFILTLVVYPLQHPRPAFPLLYSTAFLITSLYLTGQLVGAWVRMRAFGRRLGAFGLAVRKRALAR